MESNEVVLTNEENGHRSYVKPEQIVTLLDEAPEPQKVTVEDLAKRKGCFWGGGTLWMLSGASSGAESEWLEATGLDGKREGERDGFHRASIVTPVRVEIRVYGPPGFRGGE